MDEKEFKARTKRLALEVMHPVEGLPRTRSADVIARQFLRSATSIGANYRSACRAKSVADMIMKLKIVEEGRTRRCTGSNYLLRGIIFTQMSSWG
jgi:hypothetical protein